MAENPGERRSILADRIVRGHAGKRSKNRQNPFARPIKDARGAKSMKVQVMGNIYQPVPQQCAITIHVWINKKERDLRVSRNTFLGMEDNQGLLAPLGDSDKIFRIQQHALLYTIMGDPAYTYKPGRTLNSGNPVASVTVFEVVNGLPRGIRLKFVGWHAISQTEDITTDERDLSTANTSGTCSCVNTGPEEIACFMHVYFDEEPYTVLSPSGEILNGVIEFGQPGSEDPSESLTHKYRPALYGLNTTDFQAVLADATRKLGILLEQTLKTIATKSRSRAGRLPSGMSGLPLSFGAGDASVSLKEADVKEVKEKAQAEIENITKSRPKSMPIDPLLWAQVTASLLHTAASVNDYTELRKVLTAVSNMTREKLLNAIWKARAEFNESTGANPNSQSNLCSAFMPDSMKSLTKKEELLELSARMQRQLLHLRDQLVFELRGWFTDHYVGLALNSAPCGQALNLSLSQGGG